MNVVRAVSLLVVALLSLSVPYDANAICHDYAPEPPAPFPVSDADVQDLAVSGDVLFVASSSMTTALSVVNVSDVASPSVLATLDPGGPALELALNGDWLYVLISGAVVITDVSDPANPSVTNTMAVSPLYKHIATDGVNLYLARGSSIGIWELTSPTTPVFAESVGANLSIEFLHAPSGLPGILVAAGESWAGWGSVGLRTIDVSDPLSPFVADYLEFALTDECGSARAYGFDVSGTMAAISTDNGNTCTFPEIAELQIIDLSDPTSLQVIDALPAAFNPDIALFGEPGELHWAWGKRLFQVDVSSPPAFSVAAPRSIAHEDLVSPTYLGGWAVGGQGTDLIFFDVRPLPGLLATTDLSGIWGSQRNQSGVLAETDRIYVATLTSLDIYDAANPQALALLSSTPIPLSGGNTILSASIAVADDLVFLAGQDLQILNITDVSNPVLIGALADVRAIDIEVVGTTAYLVEDTPTTQDVVLVDVSDPTLPVEFDRISTDANGGIEYWNQNLYQAAWPGELLKIRLQPNLQVTSTDTFGTAFDVTIVNGIAYVPTFLGLSILDVGASAAKAPPGPVEIGTLAIEGGCRDLVHLGDHVFVSASDWESVYIVDVTDPTTPILRTRIEAPADAIAASAEFVVTADSHVPTLYLFAPQCGPDAVSSPAATIDVRPHLTVSPNPFHHSTSISFATRSAGQVSLDIYDVTGRLVRSLHRGALAPGSHRRSWNGTGKTTAGVYFVRLSTPSGTATKKVVSIQP